MIIHRLLVAVTVNTTGESFTMHNASDIDYGLAQVEYNGGTGTIKIQGRTSTDMGWIDIFSFTADGGRRVTLFPFMRADLSSESGATVYVDLIQWT